MSMPHSRLWRLIIAITLLLSFATINAAEPSATGSQRGEVYFLFLGPTKLQVQPQLDAESEAWRAAASVNTAAGYKFYLDAYPKGRYAGLAKGELAKHDELARQATERAKAEAELRPGKVFKDCAKCPEMVVISPGSFEMGSNNGKNNEKPAHRVSITRAYALGRSEVTQGQWRALMRSNPSSFIRCGNNCPVEKVSWNDAQEYARRLSQKTGKTYRLPTEAEWEYACRAGGQHEYCGSDNSDSIAWFLNNSARTTHAVASKQVNAYGLYDMNGNVWEWVEDCWQSNYENAPTDGSAWTAENCGRRVLRGGSWFSTPPNLRASFRSWNEVGVGFFYLGFRLARTLP